MSKELVISSNRHETRVAVMEDDQVVEVFYQRENEYSLAGSIHKGRVTRVLPGMQSAFVDIGLGRDAFLYVSDFFEDNDEYDKIVTSVEEKILKLDRPTAPPAQASPVEVALEAAAAPAEEGVAVPVDVLPAAPLSPPASAMQGPAGYQGRRPDRSGDRGGDRGADRAGDRGADRGADRGGDRSGEAGGDRRGRRSRRGRGQRSGSGGGGGRGLPDTKYYSPRGEGDSRYQPSPAAGIPEAAPVEEPQQPRVIFDPTQDDFFVLPGESLAKYTGGRPEDEGEQQESRPGDNSGQFAGEEESAGDAAAAVDEADRMEGSTQRMLEAAGWAQAEKVEAAVTPAPAPVAVQESEPVAEVAAKEAEPPAAEAAPVPEKAAPEGPVSGELAAAVAEVQELPIQVVSLETGFVAVQTEPELEEAAVTETGAGEAADSEAADLGAEGEEESEGESESREGEATEGEVSELAQAEGEAEEGPEPARIPTSLTATLREQGGRYPHRVSRRTRRKGRGDRGPAGEGQRGPQGEARPGEQGGEHRIVQRPEARSEGRPEGRPEGR